MTYRLCGHCRRFFAILSQKQRDDGSDGSTQRVTNDDERDLWVGCMSFL